MLSLYCFVMWEWVLGCRLWVVGGGDCPLEVQVVVVTVILWYVLCGCNVEWWWSLPKANR